MVYEYCCRGLLKPNIERLKAVYRPRLDATLSALQEHLPQASWPHPEGGFFVGVTLPETCDVAALQVKAREMGVVLSDGKGFFAYPDEGKRFLRIPFSRVTPAEIDAALARLACLL